METSTKFAIGAGVGVGVLGLFGLFASCGSGKKTSGDHLPTGMSSTQDAQRREYQAKLVAWLRQSCEEKRVFRAVLLQRLWPSMFGEGGSASGLRAEICKGVWATVEVPQPRLDIVGRPTEDCGYWSAIAETAASHGLSLQAGATGLSDIDRKILIDKAVRECRDKECSFVIGSVSSEGTVVVRCIELDQKVSAAVGCVASVSRDYLAKRASEEVMVEKGNKISGRIVRLIGMSGEIGCRLVVDGIETVSFGLAYCDRSISANPGLLPEKRKFPNVGKETRQQYRLRHEMMDKDEARRNAIAHSGRCHFIHDDIIRAVCGSYSFTVNSYDPNSATAELCAPEIDSRVLTALNERRYETVRRMSKVPLLIDGSNLLLRDRSLNWRTVRTLVRCLNEMRVEFHLYFDASIWNAFPSLDYKEGRKFVAHMKGHDAKRTTIVPAGTQADDFILLRADREGNHIVSADGFRQAEYRERYPWLENRKESGDLRVHRFDVVDGCLSIPSLDIYERIA